MNNEVKVYIMPVDRLSSAVWSGEAQKTTFKTRHSSGDPYLVGKKGNKSIYTSLAAWSQNDLAVITDENGNEIKTLQFLNNPLNEFDRVVHDTVVSIVVSGNNYFTPADVVKTMAFRRGKKVIPTQNQIKMVDESLQKILETTVNIYMEEEAKAYDCFKNDENLKRNHYTIREPLLAISRTGENDDISYYYMGDITKFESLPALYRYTQPKKQLITTSVVGDKHLLGANISLNKLSVQLKSYLYRRIQEMQRAKLSNIILMSTLMIDLNIVSKKNDIPKLNMTYRKRLYKTIETILDYWKNETDFIKDYEWMVDSEDKRLKKAKIKITY